MENFRIEEVDVKEIITLEETNAPALGCFCGAGCVGVMCGLIC